MTTSPIPQTPAEKLKLFRTLFRGRVDVFPLRFVSKKTGDSGYAPECSNKWKPGLCILKTGGKCSGCSNQAFAAVTDEVISHHLKGRHTAGVYPLLEDDRCWFLAADLAWVIGISGTRKGRFVVFSRADGRHVNTKTNGPTIRRLEDILTRGFDGGRRSERRRRGDLFQGSSAVESHVREVKMKIMIKSLLVAVGFALAACGGDSSSCKDQCDKLKSCAVSTSGVNCDASCSGPDATCAQCVNANACGDLKSKCATTCPTVHF